MTSDIYENVTTKSAYERGITDYYAGVQYHMNPVNWNNVCTELWQCGWKEAQHVAAREFEFEEWKGENEDEYNGHDM